MKISKVGLTLRVLVPLLCVAGLAARIEELRSGSYAADELGQLAQSAPAVPADDSTYGVASYPAFSLQLARGPGQAETEINCSSCHTLRYITMQPPLPAATWDAEVHKMIKAYGARISDADAQKIIQYLGARYTPETRN